MLKDLPLPTRNLLYPVYRVIFGSNLVTKKSVKDNPLHSGIRYSKLNWPFERNDSDLIAADDRTHYHATRPTGVAFYITTKIVWMKKSSDSSVT